MKKTLAALGLVGYVWVSLGAKLHETVTVQRGEAPGWVTVAFAK